MISSLQDINYIITKEAISKYIWASVYVCELKNSYTIHGKEGNIYFLNTLSVMGSNK